MSESWLKENWENMDKKQKDELRKDFGLDEFASYLEFRHEYFKYKSEDPRENIVEFFNYALDNEVLDYDEYMYFTFRNRKDYKVFARSADTARLIIYLFLRLHSQESFTENETIIEDYPVYLGYARMRYHIESVSRENVGGGSILYAKYISMPKTDESDTEHDSDTEE